MEASDLSDTPSVLGRRLSSVSPGVGELSGRRHLLDLDNLSDHQFEDQKLQLCQ